MWLKKIKNKHDSSCIHVITNKMFYCRKKLIKNYSYLLGLK